MFQGPFHTQLSPDFPRSPLELEKSHKGGCRHPSPGRALLRGHQVQPLLQPSCCRGLGSSQELGRLQGFIPGSVPRVNNSGTSQSQSSPVTTAHHKGQAEAEVPPGQREAWAQLGRAGSEAAACWGQDSGTLGRCPGVAQCEERKGSGPQSRLA